MKPINFVKVSPVKWWNKKDSSLANVLTDFNNYLLTRICDERGIDWLLSNPTTEDIKKIIKELL